jgi:hypothetical protein
MSHASASSPGASPEPRPRRPVLRFLARALRNWRERHQHPFNFAIHLIGIPMALSGVVLLFFIEWYWAAAAFIVGYLLQYLGHTVEGNDLGEWAGIKRLLGLPYVGISPRWQRDRTSASDA